MEIARAVPSPSPIAIAIAASPSPSPSAIPVTAIIFRYYDKTCNVSQYMAISTPSPSLSPSPSSEFRSGRSSRPRSRVRAWHHVRMRIRTWAMGSSMGYSKILPLLLWEHAYLKLSNSTFCLHFHFESVLSTSRFQDLVHTYIMTDKCITNKVSGQRGLLLVALHLVGIFVAAIGTTLSPATAASSPSPPPMPKIGPLPDPVDVLHPCSIGDSRASRR